MDGDGDLDVLSASHNVLNGKTTWYENTDGAGTFGPQRVVAERDGSARSVYAADVDGDGDLDIVSAFNDTPSIIWNENTDGNGNFGPERLIAAAVPLNAIVVADLDGDGDPDVLSYTSSNRSAIVWFENTDGVGGFGSKHVIDIWNGVGSVFVADVDGDGDLDVLAASLADKYEIRWYENTNGAGAFSPLKPIATATEPISGSHSSSLFAADVDGDGDMDVLFASHGDAEVEKIEWFAGLSAPVAKEDDFSWNEDGVLDVQPQEGVLANDNDTDSEILTAVLIVDVQHGTLDLAADGSFRYTPELNFFGEDRFTYRASDGALDTEPATVTITVSPVDDPSVALDDAYGTDEDTVLTVSVDNGVTTNDVELDGDELTVLLVDDVEHGSLALNENGSFSYTPNDNFFGTDRFTYRLDDGVSLSNVATVTIEVRPVNDRPVAGDDSYAVFEDNVLSVAAGAAVLADDRDADDDDLVVTLVDEPSHGVIVLKADGSFTYEPPANFFGMDSFTYFASDGALDSELATVTITVSPVDDPSVALDDAYGTDEDTVLTVSVDSGVTANDVELDGDQLTALLVDDVEHGSLALNENGTFSYAPNDNFFGTDRFTYRLNDGVSLSNVATVTIEVRSVNDRPVANDDRYAVFEDNVLSVSVSGGVLADDRDADDDDLVVTLVEDADNGTLLLNPDGSFSYEPAANFFGIDTFTYVANDGGLDSESAIVTITVNPVDDPSVAIDDNYETDEDTKLTVSVGAGVTTNDVELDGDELTALLVEDVEHGSLALDENGTFVYTPAENYFGRDRFTYRLDDGISLSNVATATIDVRSVNDRPVAGDDSYAVFEDNVLSVAAGAGVLVDDRDVEDNLVAELVEEPSHGSIVLRADGSFVYTPEDDFFGVDSFTYAAVDGDAARDEGTVTITVIPVPDDPVAADDAYLVDEDTVLQVSVANGVLANDRDGDGDELSAVLVETAASGTLSLDPLGSFLYTPNAGFFGDDSFTYLTRAGGVDSNTATVRIAVRDVNLPPAVVDDVYSIDEGSTLSIGFDLVASAGKQTIALTSFEEPAVGALEYTPGPGARELGFTRLIDADNDGTFGDEDAGGTYGVVESSDNLTLPFTDGSQGYETTGSNGGGALQPHTLLTFDAVDVSGAAGVELSFDVFVAVRGYETPDLLKVWVEAFDGAETDLLSIIEVNGDQIDAGEGITEGQWNTLRLLIDEKYQQATLRIETSTNATSLGEGFIFDNIVFARQTGAVWKYLDDGSDQGVDWRAAGFDDAAWQPGPSELGYGDGDEATLVGFGDEADEKFVTTYFRHAFDVSAADEIAELYLHLKRDDGAAVYLNGVEIARENLPPGATFVTPATDPGEANDSDFLLFQVDPELLVDGKNVLAAEVHLHDQAAENLSFDLRLVATRPPLVGILANDSDPEDDTMSVVLVAGPSNGELVLHRDGTFSYTPRANFFGTDTFTYRATGGDADSRIGTVSIGVGSINDPPLADDDSYETPEDTALNIDADEGLLANDEDPEGSPLALELVSGPAHGALTLNPDGSFRYEPELNFNGMDTFTYRISDGELTSGIATVNLTVTPVNDPPLAAGDEYSVEPGESLFVPTSEGVLANDDDPDADRLTAVLAGLPRHGIVALNADGSFLYQPRADFVGVDEFSYQASDGELTSAVATVTIVVAPELPADLTGNGFVDFEDLTVLLAAWNRNVSAAEGNLVDADTTPVNFDDLTVLLAAWTGPGAAGAPGGRRLVAAVGGDSVGDFVGADPGGAVGDYRQEIAVGDASYRQALRRAADDGCGTPTGRRCHGRFRSAGGTYRRLQAGAVDRVMDELAPAMLIRSATRHHGQRRLD